jgi:serine protease Do
MALFRFLVPLAVLAAPLMAQTAPAVPEKRPDALSDLSTATEQLARKVSRSVVQIFSTGYSFNEESDATNARSYISRQRSTGSGVILSADGYIVTNSHVVQGARHVQVQLSYGLPETEGEHRVLRRGKLIDAKIVGMDREADLAVVKIEMTGLAPLPLGNSDALRQGQLVLAVGNPLGLENSVSMGVISSTERQIHTDDPIAYIQTDASINPGNSGGPLLDSQAHVVGINTFIYTQSGGSEGIGFAIPSNLVRNTYQQIRKSGHVHRGEIGISAQTITHELAQGLSLPQDYGVVLSDVAPDGTAEEAGLKVGDIVASLDGRLLSTARQLELEVYRRSIDEQIKLEIVRGKDRLNFTVAVSEREGDPMRFADLVTPEKNTIARLGILGVGIDKETAPLLPELRKKYGIIVAARSATAPYSGTGSLQPGDVIYAVNAEPTSSVDALRGYVEKIKAGEPVVLQIERAGKLTFLTLELE